VAVVGAGLAGLGAVRALRAQGWAGRIVLVGEETHDAYDRPPLSKDFLAGTTPLASIMLAAPGDEALDVDVRRGVRAVALHAGERSVELDTGEHVGGAGVVLATGARARTLPAFEAAGVHTLRTLDDALALQVDLSSGARLVVVGAGFIGAEVASTARALGVEVTVVEQAPVPMALALGPELGEVFAGVHRDHGVRLETGIGVKGVLVDGDGWARGVALADGRELPADAVVVGVGSVPDVAWLDGSGLDVVGGVLTDMQGATSVPGIVATGDCSRRPDPVTGRVVRQEHWTNALQHPQLAVAALLGGTPPTVPASAALPYVWSDQYGHRLQIAGQRYPGDSLEVVDGSLADRRFVVVFRREGVPVAVAAVDSPKVFGRWRREIAATASVAAHPS
jgi:NADPH-dependent 2,4-dienoyl-CoA reductase/sulfur reductase-like enzyme